jgi:hypothetical protein
MPSRGSAEICTAQLESLHSVGPLQGLKGPALFDASESNASQAPTGPPCQPIHNATPQEALSFFQRPGDEEGCNLSWSCSVIGRATAELVPREDAGSTILIQQCYHTALGTCHYSVCSRASFPGQDSSFPLLKSGSKQPHQCSGR